MQKLLTFFSKNISVYAIFNDQSFNDTLINDIVSFEQLGPDSHCLGCLDTRAIFSAIVTRETAFLTSCLPSCTNPFWKGVYSKKERSWSFRRALLELHYFLNKNSLSDELHINSWHLVSCAAENREITWKVRKCALYTHSFKALLLGTVNPYIVIHLITLANQHNTCCIIVPRLAFFWCLGRAVLRDSGISKISSFIFFWFHQ